MQLSEQEQQAIQKLYAIIKHEFEVKRVMLFGSRSRGDAGEYSDIDLLVLTRKPRNLQDRLRLSNITAEINVNYGVAISCLYINMDDWEQDNNINPQLKQNIEQEGMTLAL